MPQWRADCASGAERQNKCVQSESPLIANCKAYGAKVHACAIDLEQEIRFMSLGLILVIVLIVFLLGGFSGRFGGYGYGFGHGGIGVLGTVLIIVVVLMLLGRL